MGATALASQLMPDRNLLGHVLGEVPLDEFFARHYCREPLLCRGTSAFASELATVQVCRQLVGAADVDVMLVRDGVALTGPRPDLAAADAHFADGFTWVLRDVDRADGALAELGRALASEVHGTLHLQLYRTPPSRFGFGWHCDPEEVFYFQAAGRKRMRLRQNTQHPSPLAERMPVTLSALDECTPITEHLLEPGDCLYIPSGWWHAAVADDATVSISAGIRAPTYIDALLLISAQLANEPSWRTRLPAIGRATPMSDDQRFGAWNECLSALGQHLKRELSNPAFPLRLFARSGWWQQR